MNEVAFFSEEITCPSCEQDTYCTVIEHSAQIACDQCGYSVINFEDSEDGVVLFAYEPMTVQ